MLQTDYRGGGGPKRARTNTRQGEGDWTCPQCGNVNFAFRTTCNMRKCATSKPLESSQRGVGGPIGLPIYEQIPTQMYMGGPGAPPPLSLGLPSSYGTPMALAPTSATVPYDYGASMNSTTLHNHIPRPSSYAPPGTVISGGPSYGAVPLLDGYGMNMNMNVGPPLMPVHRPSIDYGDKNGSRKRRGASDGISEGDWVCPKCGNTNFAFRTTCNMRKCGGSKPNEAARYANGPPSKAPPVTHGPPPDGSWTCETCGNVNYPFRTKCNRRNCGANKPIETKSTTSPPPLTDQ